MELFFEANGIATERQKAVFFSIIGRDTYSLLSNLFAPTKPAETQQNPGPWPRIQPMEDGGAI